MSSNALPKATRGLFEGLDDTVHLLSHSLGAMPRAARQAAQRYAQEWSDNPGAAWDEWFPRIHDTARDLAAMIGAPRGSLVFHQNVSVLLSAFLSALEPTPERCRIVSSSYDFPSSRYVMTAHRRVGFELVTVDSVDPEAIAAAVDERTLCVAVSHVFFGTGTLLDPAPVVAAARHNGALILLDAYQSVGTVPIDVTALDVDVLLGGAIKWLCGGPGLGYAYVRPQLADTLHPTVTGWLSHAEPFAFEPTLREAAGAWRFLGGTPGPLAISVAGAGIDILRRLDAQAIREHSLRLTRRLINGARDLGCSVTTPSDDARRGGTVVMDFPGAQGAAGALAERRIWVDHRPQRGLRVSPHVYTTENEVDHFLEVLAPLVG